MSQLDKLTIKGFKSIRSLENFELTKMNVLIGGNGAGKSNFIDFFRLLRAMMELPLPDIPSSNLITFIRDRGGSGDFLFNGPDVTKQIEVEMYFGANGYRFKLAPTLEEVFIFNEEGIYFRDGKIPWWSFGGGHQTSQLLKEKDVQVKGAYPSRSKYLYNSIESWRIYHFHDTRHRASMRGYESIEDHDYLRFNAENLAPFLLHLRNDHEEAYRHIIQTITLVAPFFDDFVLRPNKQERVRLRWKQKGSDYPLKPHHLSDGTIRFICLTTALLQPKPPSTFIVDEPELGLHPYAIEILAELMQAASQKTQLIVSTQSPALVDYFEPEQIIVVNREQGASTFRRLNRGELSSWLKDYSMGDLWRKNVIAGGPVHE